MNARIAKFAEPPHVTASRQEILGIEARAIAERAEIDGSMRRFENFIAGFAILSMLAMLGRIAWAWRLGLIG